MVNSPGQNPLVIERILRDRDGIWQQIIEGRDLRRLTIQMLVSSVVSLAIFGLVLGASHSAGQALSSMVKLPLLFLATLAICLPTLYLFNLVFGARLSMPQAVTLIMVSITVISVLTVAFAPISLFFLITAQNYAFFKLLNVGILVLTAFIGLRFLTGGMAALNAHHEAAFFAHARTAPPPPPVDPPAAAGGPDGAGPAGPERPEPALVGAGAAGGTPNGAPPAPVPALAVPAGAVPAVAGPAGAGTTVAVGTAVAAGPAPAPQPVPAAPQPAAAPPVPVGARPTSMALLRVWILLFGFVGTQLAWTLRPFFGDRATPFALFREISGTFYSDILQTIGRLIGG